MDQLKEITVTSKKYEHHFYCDQCNQYLGSTTEYDDGYYEEIGELQYEFHMFGWYRFKKHLCEKCRKEFENNLKVILKDIGFERE